MTMVDFARAKRVHAPVNMDSCCLNVMMGVCSSRFHGITYLLHSILIVISTFPLTLTSVGGGVDATPP